MEKGAGSAKQRAEQQYQGKVTAHLVITSIVAAIGGLIFGYIGLPGGVTANEGVADFFLERVYVEESYLDEYCQYHTEIDLFFLPSLYLPGIVAALIASPVTRIHGRKKSIIISGVSFCIGALLIAVTPQILRTGLRNVGIIIGRIIAGVGVGFGTQAIPLYLSEIAPTHFRGGSNFMFQLATSLGILTANIVNYVTRVDKQWEWNNYKGHGISFGLLAFLALLMRVGAIFLSETPNSLIQRGSTEEGRKVLEKLRGTENVEAEFQDIVAAKELASTVKRPFVSIFKRRNRPQLVITILMPMFQALTGINSLLYYASILLLNMGFKEKASFYSSVMIGAVLVSSALLSMAIVDKLGRRALLISGGILMITCQYPILYHDFQLTMFFIFHAKQVAIAIILKGKLGDHQELSRSSSIVVMVLICLFALAFGWSWGPLGWAIPSEIFPLEVRSTGQSITVAMNLLLTLIVAESFLPLLCAFRFGLFLFYAAWITAMTIFVHLFLPETKGVPIEQMTSVWRNHWFWKKIVPAQLG
ncbi:Sugar/inositol transporter [Trema orientale]|uniref:Sugar/inositol transporter n=1 Tax=Trema orientale TaxID=63057 RepID=A0A2P5B6A1_TREOI|nr:Sugar/inositol transporter [Trema orientale]